MCSTSRSLQENFCGKNSQKSLKYSQTYMYDNMCQMALLGSKGKPWWREAMSGRVTLVHQPSSLFINKKLGHVSQNFLKGRGSFLQCVLTYYMQGKWCLIAQGQSIFQSGQQILLDSVHFRHLPDGQMKVPGKIIYLRKFKLPKFFKKSNFGSQ